MTLRTPDLRRLILPLAGTIAVTLALFGTMQYWMCVELDRGAGEDHYPPWFNNLDDTSWQRELAPNASAKLGLDPNQPVRVCGASGEHAYLASLRCAGEPVVDPLPDPFSAAGARKEHLRPLLYPRIVDRYEVLCGTTTVSLYLSPYHCSGGEDDQVPAGFVPRFGG